MPQHILTSLSETRKADRGKMASELIELVERLSASVELTTVADSPKAFNL